jgi:ABC-type phosphate transport system permease subunit
MNGSYEVEANYDKAKALEYVYYILIIAVVSFVCLFCRLAKFLCGRVSGCRSLFFELWGCKLLVLLFFDLFSDMDYCRQLVTGRYVSDTFQIPLSMLIILIIFQVTGMMNAIYLTEKLRADLDYDLSDDYDLAAFDNELHYHKAAFDYDNHNKAVFAFKKELLVFVLEDFVETIVQFIFVDKFISQFQLLPNIKSWALFLYSAYKLWKIIKSVYEEEEGKKQKFFGTTMMMMMMCVFMFNLFRVVGVFLYQLQFLSSADCFNNDLNGTIVPINGKIGPINLQTPGLCFQWVDWCVLIFGSAAFIMGCILVSWLAFFGALKIRPQFQKVYVLKGDSDSDSVLKGDSDSVYSLSSLS